MQAWCLETDKDKATTRRQHQIYCGWLGLRCSVLSYAWMCMGTWQAHAEPSQSQNSPPWSNSMPCPFTEQLAISPVERGLCPAERNLACNLCLAKLCTSISSASDSRLSFRTEGASIAINMMPLWWAETEISLRRSARSKWEPHSWNTNSQLLHVMHVLLFRTGF